MTERRPGSARRAAVVASLLLLCGTVLAPAVGAAAPEWNIDRVGAPASAAGTVIAVVDTGVDAAHPAFTGRVQPAIDLVGGPGGDPNGHGTHVAGVAAGADNGCGNIGVAPDATILPVRVLDADGAGPVSLVAEGIRRAADRRDVTVINLSLGTEVLLRNVSGSELQEAIRYAWSKGKIPVLAAGNDGLFGGLFGSGYGDLPAVVVTATDRDDRAAPYATSVGSAMWGLAAPGGDATGEEGRDVLSAFPDRRCALQAGTSMSAPHVSGALAALRARGLSPRQAIDRLLSTARDLGSSGTFGHGLIDLRAALAAPPATVSTTAPAPPAPAATAAAPPGGGPVTTGAGPGSSTAPVPAAGDAGPSPAPGASVAPAAPPTGDAASGQDPTATTEGGPQPDGSAAPVVVHDIDGDDDGVPGALVAVAVAALAASGVGAGVAGRSLARRPGRP